MNTNTTNNNTSVNTTISTVNKEDNTMFDTNRMLERFGEATLHNLYNVPRPTDADIERYCIPEDEIEEEQFLDKVTAYMERFVTCPLLMETMTVSEAAEEEVKEVK